MTANNAFHSDGPREARPAGERGRWACMKSLTAILFIAALVSACGPKYMVFEPRPATLAATPRGITGWQNIELGMSVPELLPRISATPDPVEERDKCGSEDLDQFKPGQIYHCARSPFSGPRNRPTLFVPGHSVDPRYPSEASALYVVLGETGRAETIVRFFEERGYKDHERIHTFVNEYLLPELIESYGSPRILSPGQWAWQSTRTKNVVLLVGVEYDGVFVSYDASIK